jgi:hypothetical protein
VILSDIIYGPIGDLRAVSVALNEHFLFSTAQEAQRIALQRSHLRDLGLDLEEGRMEPIALYG